MCVQCAHCKPVLTYANKDTPRLKLSNTRKPQFENRVKGNMTKISTLCGQTQTHKPLFVADHNPVLSFLLCAYGHKQACVAGSVEVL